MQSIRGKMLASLLVVLFVGCQESGPIITGNNTDWTAYEATGQVFRFEYPTPLNRKTRSTDPVGLLLEKGPKDLAIAVMHGSDSEHGSDFAERMLAIALEDANPIGDARGVRFGPAKGLRQYYRMRDGYQFRLGTTIIVTTDKDRLVLDVSYPERWKKELEPVFERVVGSLQFSESGSTQTYPVSEQSTESR